MKNALLKLLLALFLGCSFCKVNAQTIVHDPVNACSRSTNTLFGDNQNITYNSYKWEISSDNGLTWTAPPAGSADQRDFQNFALNNTTGHIMKYLFRRQTVLNGDVEYDSAYDVTVLPTTISNILVDPHAQFCPGQYGPVSIAGNVPDGYVSTVTYGWQQRYEDAGANDWTDIPNASGQSYVYTPTSDRTVDVRRVAILPSTVTINGTPTPINCFAYSDYITVTILPLTPSVSGPDQSFCNASQAKLNANVPNGSETGTWTVISPAGYNPFDDNNIHDPAAVIKNLPVGTDIKLQWTIRSNMCSQGTGNPVPVTIHNFSLPMVNAGSDVGIFKGASTILSGSVNTVGNENYAFQWSPATGLDNPNILNPVASPLETTTYTLSAKTLSGQCTASDGVQVVVGTDATIPNVITPNGDGINDTWDLSKLEGYLHSEVWVYNRQGEQIFHSKGYSIPWDGTFSGKKLPTGVYYYVITINAINLKKSGSITIIN